MFNLFSKIIYLVNYLLLQYYMYYLSTLSIFKNETLNLKMWIEHYLWQGVEHLYLIDNGSTDNPLQILQEYIDKGCVTYYYNDKKFVQAEHYRYVFDTYKLKEETFWLAICDLDEFFYGVDKKLAIKLKTLEYFNVIYCNWLMFGSDKLINHPADIRISNTHREKKLNKYTKYIFKTGIIRDSSQIQIHKLREINDKRRVRIANKLIRLNHYQLQSLEYFTKVKMTRGDVNAKKRVNNFRDKKYFIKGNENTNFKDETLKQLVKTQNIL